MGKTGVSGLVLLHCWTCLLGLLRSNGRTGVEWKPRSIMKLGEGLFLWRRNQFAAAQRTGIDGPVLDVSDEKGVFLAFNGLDSADGSLSSLFESNRAQEACPLTNPLNQPAFCPLVCHRNRVSLQRDAMASDQF
jgi:hypothetical protein